MHQVPGPWVSCYVTMRSPAPCVFVFSLFDRLFSILQFSLVFLQFVRSSCTQHFLLIPYLVSSLTSFPAVISHQGNDDAGRVPKTTLTALDCFPPESAAEYSAEVCCETFDGQYPSGQPNCWDDVGLFTFEKCCRDYNATSSSSWRGLSSDADHPDAEHPDNLCFRPGDIYTFVDCCNTPAFYHGPNGNDRCWDGELYTYNACCRPANLENLYERWNQGERKFKKGTRLPHGIQCFTGMNIYGMMDASVTKAWQENLEKDIASGIRMGTPPDAALQTALFDFDICCSEEAHGPGGNSKCFNHIFTFENCCRDGRKAKAAALGAGAEDWFGTWLKEAGRDLKALEQRWWERLYDPGEGILRIPSSYETQTASPSEVEEGERRSNAAGKDALGGQHDRVGGGAFAEEERGETPSRELRKSGCDGKTVADYLVVGSGSGGSMLALRLAELLAGEDICIVVVERGDDPEDMDSASYHRRRKMYDYVKKPEFEDLMETPFTQWTQIKWPLDFSDLGGDSDDEEDVEEGTKPPEDTGAPDDTGADSSSAARKRARLAKESGLDDAALINWIETAPEAEKNYAMFGCRAVGGCSAMNGKAWTRAPHVLTNWTLWDEGMFCGAVHDLTGVSGENRKTVPGDELMDSACLERKLAARRLAALYAELAGGPAGQLLENARKIVLESFGAFGAFPPEQVDAAYRAIESKMHLRLMSPDGYGELDPVRQAFALLLGWTAGTPYLIDPHARRAGGETLESTIRPAPFSDVYDTRVRVDNLIEDFLSRSSSTVQQEASSNDARSDHLSTKRNMDGVRSLQRLLQTKRDAAESVVAQLAVAVRGADWGGDESGSALTGLWRMLRHATPDSWTVPGMEAGAEVEGLTKGTHQWFAAPVMGSDNLPGSQTRGNKNSSAWYDYQTVVRGEDGVGVLYVVSVSKFCLPLYGKNGTRGQNVGRGGLEAMS